MTPTMNYGGMPLHVTAEKVYLNIFKYIAEQLKDKNPTMSNGQAPLHSTAQNGQLLST